MPYHIGAGVLGGVLPLLATAVAAPTGNIYGGLRQVSKRMDGVTFARTARLDGEYLPIEEKRSRRYRNELF